MEVEQIMGTLLGKRPLRRLRRNWEDKIRMGLKEIGCGDGS
jgi:hypothetical protein